jgi:hypothetical protein
MSLPDFSSFATEARKASRDAFSDMGNDMVHLHAIASVEANGHKVLAPTKALYDAMRLTDATVPMGHVKPPYPALLVRLPTPLLYTHKCKVRRVRYLSVSWNDDPSASMPADDIAEIAKVGIYYLHGHGWAKKASLEAQVNFLARSALKERRLLTYVSPKDALKRCAPDMEMCITMITEDGQSLDFQCINWSRDDDGTLAHDFYEAWMTDTERLGLRINPWRTSLEFPLWQDAFRLVVNLFCYMSSPGASVSRSTSRWSAAAFHADPAERERLLEEAKRSLPADEYVLGQDLSLRHVGASLPAAAGAAAGAAAAGGHHASPRTHWRRGHWHGYWTGTSGDKRLVYMFVAPVLVVGVGSAPDNVSMSIA